MAENNVQIELELVTKAFEAGLNAALKQVESFGKGFENVEKDASTSLDKVGKAGKEAGADVAKGGKEGSQAWETFKGVLGAEAVVGAFNLIKGAVTGLFNTFVVDGVAGAREAEASLVKLKATLATTGDEANGTLEDFQAFAATMQAKTKADGDQVLSQLALAKQYGLTNEQAKQVVVTATDMAARGYDADASVKQLAESFSGQAGRLAKLNPALRSLTEEQLKAGEGAKVLAAQFAGSAVAAVNTFEGGLAQAQNAFGDLQEEIGFLITQNPALVDALQQAVALFQMVTQYVSQNGDAIKELVSGGVNLLVSSIQGALAAGAEFSEWVSENKTLIEALAVGVGVAAVAFGAYMLAVNASAIATTVATAATTAFNFAVAASPVGLAITAIAALAAGVYYLSQNWDAATAAIAEFGGNTLQSLLPIIELILETMSPLVALFSEDLAASLELAKETVALKSEELLAFAAQKEAELAALKQANRDKQAAADAVAAKAKTAGVAQQTAEEIGLLTQHEAAKTSAQVQGDTERLGQMTARLKAEAEAQKAAEKAAKEEKDKLDKEKKEAERKLQQELEADRKAARDLHAKNEKEWQDEQFRRKVAADEKRYNQEQSLTGALRSELTARKTFEESTNKEKVANFRSTLGEISSLQSSANAELFAVGKAAAIAQATINTYQAANVALASAPPPYNYGLAAAVVTAGLLNVSKIASARAPQASAGSFAEGGIVGGSSFTGDKLTANVNSREAIFTMSQQKRLFELATGEGAGGASGAVLAELQALRSVLAAQPIIVTLDGEAIATAVRNQVQSGFSLGGA